MSVKEKYLRRLLTEAEFYMNNIDGDDPQDLVGDAVKAGSGKNPIDAAILAEENKAEEDSKGENKEANNVGIKYSFYRLLLVKLSSLNGSRKQRS